METEKTANSVTVIQETLRSQTYNILTTLEVSISTNVLWVEKELTETVWMVNAIKFCYTFSVIKLLRYSIRILFLLVSQVCNEDGMEFTLRTPEGFYGRIYTYGFYDRCFFRGNGGTVNVLRISGAQGYPECGTQRYGDTMTNIAVVQFSDYVQTGKDKRFNLTCLFRGPGEAVVSSGFIGAG